MKNKTLRNLNFKKLLEYPDDFQTKHKYDPPINCNRFCIECEKNGEMTNACGATLMSHGCDTDDFEAILGPRIINRDEVKEPIMFLLEDPGGDWKEIREERTHEDDKNLKKKIPVKHYYFSPSSESWPQSVEEVKSNGNYYGTYFAYVMQKYSLANVYITNLVKCKWVGSKRSVKAEDTCVNLYLQKELDEFLPRIVFCFGRIAYGAMGGRFPNLREKCVYLRHPAYRRPSKFFSENDEKIRDALNKLKQAQPTNIQP
jgi:hypothetical protein